MTVKELKKNEVYEFECNMSEEYKDYSNHDEWGCAFVWLGDIGVEYNFAIETNSDDNEVYTACAIYKTEINNDTGYMETDYDTFNHYDIDFNKPSWKTELEIAMCESLIEFHSL